MKNILAFAVFSISFYYSQLSTAQEVEKVSPYFARGVSNSLTASLVAVAEKCATNEGQTQVAVATELEKLHKRVKELETQIAKFNETSKEQKHVETK